MGGIGAVDKVKTKRIEQLAKFYSAVPPTSLAQFKKAIVDIGKSLNKAGYDKESIKRYLDGQIEKYL
jgi:hypothetical protein